MFEKNKKKKYVRKGNYVRKKKIFKNIFENKNYE